MRNLPLDLILKVPNLNCVVFSGSYMHTHTDTVHAHGFGSMSDFFYFGRLAGMQ